MLMFITYEIFSSDCTLRSFWRAVNLNVNKFTSGNILLTGATGFLGAFILQKLLETQVITIIYYLVILLFIIFYDHVLVYNTNIYYLG